MTHAGDARKAGLALDKPTLDCLMQVMITESMRNTPGEELPQRFTFNPCASMGLGGFRETIATINTTHMSAPHGQSAAQGRMILEGKHS